MQDRRKRRRSGGQGLKEREKEKEPSWLEDTAWGAEGSLETAGRKEETKTHREQKDIRVGEEGEINTHTSQNTRIGEGEAEEVDGGRRPGQHEKSKKRGHDSRRELRKWQHVEEWNRDKLRSHEGPGPLQKLT